MTWLPYFNGDIFLSQSWVVFSSTYTYFNYLNFFLRVLNLHFFIIEFLFWFYFTMHHLFVGFLGSILCFILNQPLYLNIHHVFFPPFYLYLWFLIILFVAFSFVLVVFVKIKYLRMFNQCFFVTFPFVFAIFSLISCWAFINAFNYNSNHIC